MFDFYFVVPWHNTDRIEMFRKSKHVGSVVLNTLDTIGEPVTPTHLIHFYTIKLIYVKYHPDRQPEIYAQCTNVIHCPVLRDRTGNSCSGFIHQ